MSGPDIAGPRVSSDKKVHGELHRTA